MVRALGDCHLAGASLSDTCSASHVLTFVKGYSTIFLGKKEMGC
jgi:hypothetical protein